MNLLCNVIILMLALNNLACGDEVPLPTFNKGMRKALEQANDIVVCKLIARGRPFPGSGSFTDFSDAKFEVEKVYGHRFPSTINCSFRVHTHLGIFEEAVPQEGKSYILIGHLMTDNRFNLLKMLAAKTCNMDLIQLWWPKDQDSRMAESMVIMGLNTFDWPSPNARPKKPEEILAAIELEEARVEGIFRKRLAMMFVLGLVSGATMIWRIIKTPSPARQG